MRLDFRIRKPGGLRSGTIPPPRQLTSDEIATLDQAPVRARRAVDWIVEYRLQHGHGPSAASVWSMFMFGVPDQIPRKEDRWPATRVRSPRRPGGPARVRCQMMPGPAHVRYVLWILLDYGVRWIPTSPGSIRVLRPHHRYYLKPQAIERMRARGDWPPRRRYRGPRSPR